MPTKNISSIEIRDSLKKWYFYLSFVIFTAMFYFSLTELLQLKITTIKSLVFVPFIFFYGIFIIGYAADCIRAKKFTHPGESECSMGISYVWSIILYLIGMVLAYFIS